MAQLFATGIYTTIWTLPEAKGRAEGEAELIGKWQQAVLEVLECHFAPLEFSQVCER